MTCRLELIENNKVKPFYVKVTDHLTKKHSVQETEISAFTARLLDLWKQELQAELILDKNGSPVAIQFQNEKHLTAFLIKWI